MVVAVTVVIMAATVAVAVVVRSGERNKKKEETGGEVAEELIEEEMKENEASEEGDDPDAELYRAKPAQLKSCVDAAQLNLPVLAPMSSSPRRWTIHPDVPFGFVVDDVLTKAECEALIAALESSNFFSFWAPQSGRAFRDCDTIEVLRPDWADALWERLRGAFLPDELAVSIMSSEQDPVRHQRDLEGTWGAYSTNPHLLFSRYEEGGHFAALFPCPCRFQSVQCARVTESCLCGWTTWDSLAAAQLRIGQLSYIRVGRIAQRCCCT
jgi:hypothetical protein